jgi:hypothetical protein
VWPFVEHGDVWQFDVRATDLYGQVSAAQEVTLTIDLVGPSVMLNAPTVLTGTFNGITGTVTDSPDGSQAASVVVKLDDGLWRETALFAPDPAGAQTFYWTWDMPTDDGVTHTLQAQATDLAGNVELDTPHSVWVDNVGPALTVTDALTQVVVQNYRPGVGAGGPVISGTVSDGGGLASLVVRVELPDGTSYEEAITWDGQAWQYTPELTLVGTHRLRVTATDELGNATQSEKLDLPVIAAPDTRGNQFLTPEDSPIAFEPLLDDLDLDGDTLYLAAIGNPPHGSAVISGTTWAVYTPTLNFNGTDVFTYTASDGALFDTATITVTVSPVNDAPVLVAGHAVSVTMSEDGAPTGFDLTLDAGDVDGDTLDWRVEQEALHGTASISNTLGLTHSHAIVAYTPAADYTGADSFSVLVGDGEFSDTILVNLTIEPMDDAPRAMDDPGPGRPHDHPGCPRQRRRSGRSSPHHQRRGLARKRQRHHLR